MHAALDGPAQLALLDLGQDVRQHVAEEDRDDGRRGLVGAQPVIVARRGDRGPEQVGVDVDRPDHGAEEDQELQVGVGVVLRVEQVDAGVGRHRPVVVLARAVDAGERLLVQDGLQPVPRGHALEGLHQQHLVVAADVADLEQRRDLVLAGRHLVVPGLDRDAEAVELALGLGHEGQHTRRNGAEVVVLELLALGRPGAEQGPVADHQVGALEVQLAVDQEVFLLRSDRGVDPVNAGVGPEQTEDPHRLLRERFHRAEQGDLGVQRLAGPRHEGRRDAERDGAAAPDQEGGAGRVPRGVAAGLEGRAEAAGREARRVGLALDQVAPGEVEHHPPRPVRRDQGIVLLGGGAGQRLEPVREVGRPVLDGPVLHRRRDHVGHLRIERLALVDGPLQAAEDLLGQALPHDLGGEDIPAEDLVDAISKGWRSGAIGGGAHRGRSSCLEVDRASPGGVTTRRPVRRGWSIVGRGAEGQRGADGQADGGQADRSCAAGSTRNVIPSPEGRGICSGGDPDRTGTGDRWGNRPPSAWRAWSNVENREWKSPRTLWITALPGPGHPAGPSLMEAGPGSPQSPAVSSARGRTGRSSP